MMDIQRIVSLAPSNTEIIFALGEGNKLVGVTEFCSYPQEARLIERIGGFSTPDIDKIIVLSPDLVLAADFHTPVISQLESRGVNMRIVQAKTILDVPKAILFIGTLIDREKEASELAQNVQAQIEAIEEKTKHLMSDEKPGVCYICSHDPLRIARCMCCVNKTIELAGGINIGTEIQGDAINIETIVSKNPDIIIVSSGHGETVDLLNYVKNKPVFHKTSAYKSNRVYRVRADLFTRFGPRAVEGLKEIARFVHPEIFGEAKIK